MKLERRPPADALGTILAHSQRTASGVIRKGTPLGAAEVAALAGGPDLTVAVLDDGDVGEDAAARTVASAVAGEHLQIERAETGRSNLHAACDGLAVIDAAAVHRLNAVDPAVTLATLAQFQRVSAGQMVGTVKIIPFAVPGEVLERAVAEAPQPALRVAPWRAKAVTAISTVLPVLKPSVVTKTLRVLDGRLQGTGATVCDDVRVSHETAPLAEALLNASGDIAIVFGASAVMDEDDVIPHAIRAAGGRVEHVGMPVDPGNLLVLGDVGGRPVIGAPGCARSPKRNGFDWVLDRLLADITVTRDDVVAMGVGGLLTEAPVRARLRTDSAWAGASSPAALVLAAGRSTRMGAVNKLLEPVAGVPMVRRAAEAALGSRAEPVIVVTGHEADRVAAALEGLDVAFVHNPDFAQGLSTSLRAGLGALPHGSDAALVLLGDMPLVTSSACDRVLDALGDPQTLVAVPTAGGRRGNPVAWSRALFPDLMAQTGDTGGRALLARHKDATALVEIGEAAALDADTPEALETIRAAQSAAS